MKKGADNQKGFTLIELLVVIGILGLVVSVISMSIIQIITVTERNNAKIIALTDIEHAAAWLNQDLPMTQTILVNDEPMLVGVPPIDLVAGDNLTLKWTDYYDAAAITHQSRYYVSGTRLMRDSDGQLANIASYILEAKFSMDYVNELELVTFTLTSSPGSISGRSETKTYRIYQRSKEILE